jgi:hypothetical protein
VTVAENTPSTITTARNHNRINLSTRRLLTRLSTSTINRSWSMLPKKTVITCRHPYLG